MCGETWKIPNHTRQVRERQLSQDRTGQLAMLSLAESLSIFIESLPDNEKSP